MLGEKWTVWSQAVDRKTSFAKKGMEKKIGKEIEGFDVLGNKPLN